MNLKLFTFYLVCSNIGQKSKPDNLNVQMFGGSECVIGRKLNIISSNTKMQSQQKIIHSLYNCKKWAHETFRKMYRLGRHIIKQAETNTLWKPQHAFSYVWILVNSVYM